MRVLFLALGLSAGIGLLLSAQGLPPTSVVDDAAKRVEERARLLGESLADRSKVVMGTLIGGEARTIGKWDLAVRAWKSEKSGRAAPLLAEGVLFDCASRLHGIVTGVLKSEKAVPYFLDLAAQRPKRASKAFQAALKLDPTLAEARFRDARIRAEKDQDARKELDRLGNQTGVMAYLAAMSLAETASRRKDADGARRWYERAAMLLPTAPAPRLGLAALAPGGPIPFDSLDSTDPYYSYPCVVLTEPVRTELARRIGP